MRLVIDSLIALMLVAMLAGLMLREKRQRLELDHYQQVHQALSQLHELSLYNGALGQTPTTTAGFPRQISPRWFSHHGLPTNIIVPGRLPWLDVAPPGDVMNHPPDPVINTNTQAGFWYNPTRGIFRARVPKQFTDQQALDLYNQLNNTALLSLPHDPNPSRHPQPLSFADTSTTTNTKINPPTHATIDVKPTVKPTVNQPQPTPDEPPIRTLNDLVRSRKSKK